MELGLENFIQKGSVKEEVIGFSRNRKRNGEVGRLLGRLAQGNDRSRVQRIFSSDFHSSLKS